MTWNPGTCVVVPVDFSESSAPAIRQALDMGFSAENVHVLHVIPDLDMVSPGVVFGNITDETRVLAAEKHTLSFLSENSIAGVNTAILIGDPGTEVVEYATGHQASMIVIPSHGYHGVKHLLLGSVAERIIRYANCSVLVLRRHDAE